LPFVQLAFARAEVALDAAVIEAAPPLPAHDTRLKHLAMAYGHTFTSAIGLIYHNTAITIVSSATTTSTA
jgi:hypothetical protein